MNDGEHVLFTPVIVTLRHISAPDSGDHTPQSPWPTQHTQPSFAVGRGTSFLIEHARALHVLRREADTMTALLLADREDALPRLPWASPLSTENTVQ